MHKDRDFARAHSPSKRRNNIKLRRIVAAIPHVSRKDSSSEMRIAQMIISSPIILCQWLATKQYLHVMHV